MSTTSAGALGGQGTAFIVYKCREEPETVQEVNELIRNSGNMGETGMEVNLIGLAQEEELAYGNNLGFPTTRRLKEYHVSY